MSERDYQLRAYDRMRGYRQDGAMYIRRTKCCTARQALRALNELYPNHSPWAMLKCGSTELPLDEPVPLFDNIGMLLDDRFGVFDQDAVNEMRWSVPPPPIETSPDEIGELEFRRR